MVITPGFDTFYLILNFDADLKGSSHFDIDLILSTAFKNGSQKGMFEH